MENKLHEFEIEMERLSSRMEHLKSQNEVLNLTLIESKNHCDNLTVLIGKYESNHTAQNLIIAYLDHVIESFEVLVNLLESNQNSVLKMDKSSSRQVAENLAKKLIKRLDSVIRPDSGLAQASGSSLESSAWTEDSSGYTTSSASPSLGSNGGGSGIIGMTTSSIGSFVYTSDPANNKTSPDEKTTLVVVHEQDPKSLESKVREIIGQLRLARSSVQSTITELESHHPEYGSLPHPPASVQDQKSESKTAELEMAVLVQVRFFCENAFDFSIHFNFQELMAMREEKADLRAQVYLMERENKSLELMINSQQAQEYALKTHIQHLQDEIDHKSTVV